MGKYIEWNTALFVVVTSHLVGIWLFYLAFIYQNNSTDRFNPKQNPFHSIMRFKDEEQKQIYKDQWFPTQSEQLIFQVIDGFYFPWVVNKEEQQRLADQKSNRQSNSYYTNVTFKAPIEHLINEPKNTILMEGYADGPTMSAVRIKSLIKANLPLHIEMINNIRGVMMPDDNIVYQEKINGQGKNVLFYGYLFWDQLVGQHFDRKNTTDQAPLSTSKADDQQIYETIEEEQRESDWSTLFTHYEAIDMAVHTYRSVREPTFPTVEFHSNILTKVIDNTKKTEQNQTIIYLTDHGQNELHHSMHGGYTELEKSVIIFGYDKRGFIQKADRDFGQIMDREYLLSPQVNQIDISATYCMLRGIPLPALNIGIIIPDFFINRSDVDNTVIINNYFVNVNQIFSYLTLLRNEFKKTIIAYSELQSDIDGITNTYNSLFDYYDRNGQIQDQDVKAFVNSSIQFASKVKQVFHEEIVGPRIFLSQLSTFYFFMVFIVLYIFSAKVSNIVYNSDSVSDSESETKMNDINRLYIKLGIFSIAAVIFLLQNFFLSLVSYLSFFLFFILIMISFVRIQLKDTTFKELCAPLKVSNSKLFGYLDSILVFLGIVFNSVLRLTNDFFEISYDLTQAFLLIFYSVWLMMTLCSRQLSIMRKLFTTLLICTAPILTYICGYYSEFANKKTNQIFLVDEYVPYFCSADAKFRNPLLLLCCIYIILMIKALPAIKGRCYLLKRSIFSALLSVQLWLVCYFFMYQQKNEQQNGKEVEPEEYNIPAISYLLLFIIEMFKIIFINRDKTSPPNFSWKYATFLMNFFLTCLYVLHHQTIIKYAVLLIIIYTLGYLTTTLNIAQWASKYLFLYLLSNWFFYVSDHLERIESLHVEVLNVGALFGGVFYPVLNGSINTFFGQLVTSMVLPLFVIVEQYYKQKQSSLDENEKTASFLDIIFSNAAHLSLFNKAEQSVGYSFQNISNQELKIYQQKISQQYENLNIRAYFFFLIACISSFSIAILRNVLKPYDYFINKYYIPSFFFQSLFFAVFVLVFLINYFLIRLHETIPKRKLLDYNQMDTEDVELELNSNINSQL